MPLNDNNKRLNGEHPALKRVEEKNTQDHGCNALVRALDICIIHNTPPLPFPVANEALFLHNRLYLQSPGCRRRASIGQQHTGRPEEDGNGNVSPVRSVQVGGRGRERRSREKFRAVVTGGFGERGAPDAGGVGGSSRRPYPGSG